MWWQILLVLAAWVVCSLLFGVVWALGHRARPPHRCRACTMPRELGPLMKSASAPPRQSGRVYGGYGQKPAPVQAPAPMRVTDPVPKAPKK